MQRKFLEYLIPSILVNIAVYVTTVVDSIIVGNMLGEAALSAVGLSSPVIYSINAMYLLFAIGGATCASIAKGRRETDNANRIFTITFAAGFTAMFALLAVFLIFMKLITSALAQGNQALAEMTRAYLTPLVCSGPIIMLIMGMGQFVRTDGKPKIAAYIAIVMNVTNIILTYSFIRFFDMGLWGVGLSTVLGYTAGIFAVIPYLRSKERTLRFIKPKNVDFAQIPHIAAIGSPKALRQGWLFLRTLILNGLIVSTLGSTGMAAMAVCSNAFMLISMFISGTNDTLLPIAGTLYGEKDYPGIRFVVRTGFKFLIAACVLVMVFLLAFPGEIGRLFGIHSAEGIAIVKPALRMYALSLPLYSINVMLYSFYQTTKRIKLASLIVSLNSFVFVTLFAFMFAGINANLIWLAFVLSDAATLIVLFGAGIHIRRKENVAGILLLHKDLQSISLDLSIPAAVEAATGLSEQVIQFCRKQGMRTFGSLPMERIRSTDDSGAMRMGIAVEEMAVNTALYGHKKNKGVIDVLVRVTDDELILRLRDDGAPFDPVKYQPEEESEFAMGGIEMVRRLADDISYTRQLGFNVTIITIKRSVLKEK
ncbi:MAG: ATP-binding protein [Treponema sp.]|nr:ATP-binding protein [Treponema sp.]